MSTSQLSLPQQTKHLQASDGQQPLAWLHAATVLHRLQSFVRLKPLKGVARVFGYVVLTQYKPHDTAAPSLPYCFSSNSTAKGSIQDSVS